jgi:hypothetical protein
MHGALRDWQVVHGDKGTRDVAALTAKRRETGEKM